MAVFTYAVVAADVIAEIPDFDPTSIGAATEPVNTGDVTTWIVDVSAQLNTLWAKHGITPAATMDADSLAKCAEAVRAGVAAKVLLVSGYAGPLYREMRDKFLTQKAELSATPQNMGLGWSPGVTVAADDDDGPSEAEWDFSADDGSVF